MQVFPMATRTALALCAALPLVACTPSAEQYDAESYHAPAASVADTSALIPSGWRETVISVSDIAGWQDFYTQTLGWEVRSEGAVSRALLSAWKLPDTASARFVLVANPGSDRGFVRIVDFDGVEQQRVRDHAQAWETGGIYNMNVRVANMHDIAPKVTEIGWQAPSAPVNFVFGPFEVWEWIPRHPDGVRMAFAERVKPPLEGWPHLKTTSRAFNSTQIVGDMGAAIDFYQGILGFDAYLEHQGASGKAQDHVLGLSHQAMTSVTRDVRILSPTGENDGSVELLFFDNYSGRNFSERAVPPNLGNLMLRYPVPDADSLAAYLEGAGVALEFEPVTTLLAPYGTVRLLAIRAPDGAWLEFFEVLDRTPS